MAKSDIVVGEERITVHTGPSAPERDSIVIGPRENAEPGIHLDTDGDGHGESESTRVYADGSTGRLLLADAGGMAHPEVTLDAEERRIVLGGRADGDPGVTIDGENEQVLFRGESESDAAFVLHRYGLWLGGTGGESDAIVSLRGGAERRLRIDSNRGPTTVGADRVTIGSDDDVSLQGPPDPRLGLGSRSEPLDVDGVTSDHVIDLDASWGRIVAGGDGTTGRLELVDGQNGRWASLVHRPDGRSRFRIRSAYGTNVELLSGSYGESNPDVSPRIRLDSLARTSSGSRALLELGTESGGHGELVMRKDGTAFCSIEDGVVRLDGSASGQAGIDVRSGDGTAVAGIGGSGTGGYLGLGRADGSTTVEVAGSSALVLVGGSGTDGAIGLSTANGTTQGVLATTQGLVLMDANDNPALRVDPDGTVRTKNGEVKPL